MRRNTKEVMDVLVCLYDKQRLIERVHLRRDHEASGLVRRGDPKRQLTPYASCHGVNAQGGRNETPSLAGQSVEYLVRSMKAFRDGCRENDVHYGMGQFAWELDDAEILALADYYAVREK